MAGKFPGVNVVQGETVYWTDPKLQPGYVNKNPKTVDELYEAIGRGSGADPFYRATEAEKAYWREQQVKNNWTHHQLQWAFRDALKGVPGWENYAGWEQGIKPPKEMLDSLLSPEQLQIMKDRERARREQERDPNYQYQEALKIFNRSKIPKHRRADPNAPVRLSELEKYGSEEAALAARKAFLDREQGEAQERFDRDVRNITRKQERLEKTWVAPHLAAQQQGQQQGQTQNANGMFGNPGDSLFSYNWQPNQSSSTQGMFAQGRGTASSPSNYGPPASNWGMNNPLPQNYFGTASMASGYGPGSAWAQKQQQLQEAGPRGFPPNSGSLYQNLVAKPY